MNTSDIEVETPTSSSAISLDLAPCFPNVSALLRCISALTKEYYYKFDARQAIRDTIFGVNTDLLNSGESAEVTGEGVSSNEP